MAGATAKQSLRTAFVPNAIYQLTTVRPHHGRAADKIGKTFGMVRVCVAAPAPAGVRQETDQLFCRPGLIARSYTNAPKMAPMCGPSV